MVSTRAPTKGPSRDQDTKPAKVTSKKRTHRKTETSNTPKKIAPTKKIKKKADDRHSKQESKSEVQDKPSTTDSKSEASTYPKIDSLIEKYGAIPLSNTALEGLQSPKPETILALLLNAMFSSARNSHDLAAKTTATAIKVHYHKVDALRKSSWDERTEVLTEGGYTRYREKRATGLGELVELIDSKYDGDLNNLLPDLSTDSSPSEIRKRLKEIKGVGDVGIDIFVDTAQAVWPCLAPFLDPRSANTADALGLPSDAQILWECKEIYKDPLRMCRLASALTNVRLDKREGEFK
ncbi:hypothetical protein EDD37DRAFT_645410 [Exophiala viscosa]|uniref:HhH-GPD domain-containing protein n=1 Tax=Exophiala viscosa TaxID=2486360 RepID=A0AAN6IH17_9EURO|nr:hypothetical protein EDD36DRAFT_146001 [Exophiala viscosa]KAI1629663.1 hypothetical protein EDD37DRAFT_645410 [Exophiala viscosa]